MCLEGLGLKFQVLRDTEFEVIQKWNQCERCLEVVDVVQLGHMEVVLVLPEHVARKVLFGDLFAAHLALHVVLLEELLLVGRYTAEFSTTHRALGVFDLPGRALANVLALVRIF